MKFFALSVSFVSLFVLSACSGKPAAGNPPEQVNTQARIGQPTQAPSEAALPATATAAPVEPAAQPTQAVQPGTEAATAAPATPGSDKKYRGEPGRQFIVTDLHVGPNRTIDAGDIKIKNPDAMKLRISPNSELAPPGNPVGNDVQTPTTQGLRRPPFRPRATDGSSTTQGQAQGN